MFKTLAKSKNTYIQAPNTYSIIASAAVLWIFMIDYVFPHLHVEHFFFKYLFDIKMWNNSRLFFRDEKQKTIYMVVR